MLLGGFIKEPYVTCLIDHAQLLTIVGLAIIGKNIFYCSLYLKRNKSYLYFRSVGYYTHGSDYHEKLEETIRLSVEKCDCLHGFLLMYLLDGEIDSGLGTVTLKLINDLYKAVDE